MLKATKSLTELFCIPRFFITVKGNPRSESVMARLNPNDCIVFPDDAAVKNFFESGVSPDSVVAISDQKGKPHQNYTFTTCLRAQNLLPSWAKSCHWGIAVFPGCVTDHFVRNCAEQANAHFKRNFERNLLQGDYPWGRTRNGENSPANVVIPRHVRETLKRLNDDDAPNLANAIAEETCALELPTGSKISWIRVAHDPLHCDMAQMQAAVDAMEKFEKVCSALAGMSADVQDRLAAGVDIDDALLNVYIYPKTDHFSVRRPDFHFTGEQDVFASENDEMPGGMAELAFLDSVYGLNQERWKQCFDWLCRDGRLLFIVSHEWSKCYVTEIRWLTGYLEKLGYDVGLMTTENMEELTIRPDGVYDGHGKIGTIWRQFPIFEAKGKLVDLVLAAHNGNVRMVPEFAHYGNKVWFSIFRSHNAFFKKFLDSATFQLLNRLLPDSHLVRSDTDFPFTVEGITIDSLSALCSLPPRVRDGLVMKLSGANTLTARSYGVIMGHGLSQETWGDWVLERMQRQQPFIVQRRLETGTIDLPVVNTGKNIGELFHCRVLLRPWSVGGKLVSVHACAVPSNTLRVHGRVDMCVPPILLV